MSGRRSKKLRKQMAIGALAAYTAFSTPASAQEPPPRPEVTLKIAESIDVTSTMPAISSPKYTQPILETPQTITIIPKDVIVAQGATTFREILRNTPGITFQAGEGGGGLPGDTFSMRGFSSGNDISVDGVREVGSYTRDAFNLEQVEVVKGPSSVIAGRGASGGSINLVTKTPGMDTSASAAITGGNAAQKRVTVDANTSVDLFSTGFRINALYNESGVPGRDVVENRSWGLAPSMTIGMGKPTRFTISSQHFSQDNVPDYGLPWAALDAAVDQSNFYGLKDYDFEEITSDLATARLEHDLRDGWTVRNVSRWADNHRDSAITAPRPPNRQLQQRTMDHHQLTNQTSVNGFFTTGTLRHDFVAGVELGRESTMSQRQAQTTNQPQTTLANPDPSERPLAAMPRNVGAPESAALDLAGVYAIDTLHLGSRWEVNAGFRGDLVDVDYELKNAATGAITTLGRSDRMLSWSAAVTFMPRPSASLYAGVGTAFNPTVEAGTVGAGLSDSPTSLNNVNLDPEETLNSEIGMKWAFGGGRAIASAALFRTEKTNARTRSATNEPFVLEGRQRVDGLEVGITGRIADGWTVLAGYSHLDSEFVASANPVEEGAALAFTPEHSFNLWTDLRLPLGFSFGAGTQYMDGVYRNAANTAEVPPYWLVNAMAAYEVTDSLTLRLNVNNLADEQHVDRVGGGHYIPGPRRSVRLGADFRF